MPKKSKKVEEEIFSRLSPVEWGLIICVVMVSTLAVIVSIDPNRRLNEATNARRFSDVTGILDDIKDYEKKYDVLPDALLSLSPGYAYEIGLCETGGQCTAVSVQDACVDISDLGETPVDPEIGFPQHTGYYLIVHEENEVTVGSCAPDPEMAMGEGAVPAINLRD